MENNHVIIGLGGTGGNTIAAFKRLLFENKNGETDSSKYGVECIYVDSSSSDLKMQESQWKIMGTDISLGKAQLLEIESPEIMPYVQNSNSYPNLKYWIGGANQWQDLLKDKDKQFQAGGQRRKLGRLNFALKADEFVQLFNTRVGILKKLSKGEFKLKFHVCAGLAGGTGSGAIVDVCALLRKNYPDSKINVYCVLPETTPTFKNPVTPFYHANGYASLMELNALGLGSFLPYDLSNKMQVDNEKIGGEAGLKDTPFNLCYLLADMNEGNFPLSPNGNEKNPIGSLIQNLAEYIFQTTVISNPKIAGAVQRAEKMENPPELPNSNFGFSNKFFAFGYKRFAIPEQEIKEYFAYLFGYQAVLQFLYNNFNKSEGYLDRSTSQSYNSIVSNNEFLVKFNLTRDHLILSKDILDQYKKDIRDGGIDSVFYDTMSTITNKVKQGSSMDNRPIIKEQWLDAILIWGNKFFDKSFRTIGQEGGVLSFYDTKIRDKQNLAKKIVDNIEEKFFNDWHAGIKSIDQIHGILTALNNYLKDEKEKFNAEIAKNSQTIQALENAIVKIKEDWRPGFLSKIFNDSEGKVKDTQKNVTELLILRTKNRGYLYAQELIDSITPNLSNLLANISAVNGYFNKIKETFQNEHLSRCLDEEANSASVLIKYYDPKLIRDFASKLSRNNEIINERIAALRDIIYILAKDSGTYFEKLKKANIEDIQESLEKESMALSKTFFADPKLISKISDEKFINQNILQKLKEDYSGDDQALKEKLTLLVNQAALMSKFDLSQKDSDSTTDERATMVIIPENIGDDDFNNKISKLFYDISSHLEIGIGGNQNELLIFNVKRGAQAREFTNVSNLKEKYDSLMASRGIAAKFVCHIEDVEILPEKPSEERMDAYKQDNKNKSILYSLFPPSEGEKKKRIQTIQDNALPYLLLGKACGTILDAEHPETGRMVICLMKETELGDEPIILGNNLWESLDKLDSELSHLLITKTKEKLSQSYKHVSTHETLKQNIKQELGLIQQSFNNNPLNSTVKRFKESGLKALEILNKMN